jgi:hypothetical protein
MKTFIDNNAVAQGELLIRKVDALPSGLKEMETENGAFIIGHSETGHHHVVRKQKGVVVYANDNNPFELYLVVNNPEKEAELEHRRNTDTHKSYFFGDGIYHIRRQWEDDGKDLRPVID